MDRKVARQKYATQKSHARLRGIEFKLTFDEWLDWWGDDLDSRGSKGYQLGMNRILDKGSYELGNIVKGYPKDNAKTRDNCVLARRSAKRAAANERAKDEVPVVAKDNWLDELSEDERELNQMFRVRRSYTWNWGWPA